MLSDYGIMRISSNGQPVPAPGSYKLHQAPEVVSGGNVSVTTDIYQVDLTLFRLPPDSQRLRPREDYYFAATAGNPIVKNDFPPFVPAALRRILATGDLRCCRRPVSDSPTTNFSC